MYVYPIFSKYWKYFHLRNTSILIYPCLRFLENIPIICIPIFSKYWKYFHFQNMHYFEVGKKSKCAPVYFKPRPPTRPSNSKLPWPRGPKFSELCFTITIGEIRKVTFSQCPKYVDLQIWKLASLIFFYIKIYYIFVVIVKWVRWSEWVKWSEVRQKKFSNFSETWHT